MESRADNAYSLSLILSLQWDPFNEYAFAGRAHQIGHLYYLIHNIKVLKRNKVYEKLSYILKLIILLKPKSHEIQSVFRNPRCALDF